MAPPPVRRLSDLCCDGAEAQLCAHSVGRTPGLGQGPSRLLPVLPRGGLRWVYLSGWVCKYLCVHLGAEGLGWSPPISSAHSSSSRAFLSLRCGPSPLQHRGLHSILLPALCPPSSAAPASQLRGPGPFIFEALFLFTPPPPPTFSEMEGYRNCERGMLTDKAAHLSEASTSGPWAFLFTS